MKALLILTMLLISCGDEQPEQVQPDSTLTNENKPSGQPGDEAEYSESNIVANTQKLKKCNEKRQGQLVYIMDDEVFVACDFGEWIEIDAKGEDGTDGEDEDMLTLIDINGDEVGSIHWVDSSTGDFWVTGSEDERYEIDRVTGAFPNGYFYFSETGCTGEIRMGISNGEFKNVAYNFADSQIQKKVGDNLGVFAYKSRMPASTNCADVTSTVNDSWEVEDHTPAFTYPVDTPEIKN